MIRSKLFVPGSRPELFEKAAGSAADALSFDLEDAVAQEKKAEARSTSHRSCSAQDFPGKIMIVRVNEISSHLFEADIEAIVSAGAGTSSMCRSWNPPTT